MSYVTLRRCPKNARWPKKNPMGTKRPQPFDGPGQVKQSGSTLIFGPSYSATRRAEMLLGYIYRSITHRVHFLDKASWDLLIYAKDLFVEATPARKRLR